MLLDAQLRLLSTFAQAQSRRWDAWAIQFRSLYSIANVLLGLACIATAVVIVRCYRRRLDLRTARANRGDVWMLSSFLTVCAVAQFTGILAAAPVLWMAGMSVLTALACWAAAVALLPLLAQLPVNRDDESYERAIAERLRTEEALRTSEAEARKWAEADARKNEFLAMLGHELRNPLAPIRNAVKIMKQRGSDDPDLCWARDVVDHQVRQLAQLVDDLLEISRVTSGKVRLQKEPVDIATIVAFAVETSRPTIEAHHHRLSIALPSAPILVDADSIRMAQVLSNLLNNAAKYTQPGGQIRLAAYDEGIRGCIPSPGQRDWHSPRDAFEYLRLVRSGRSFARPLPRGSRIRPDSS